MEDTCKCLKIEGHLEAVKWLLYPREYKLSAGPLALADWTTRPHVWLHYVESADGLLPDDDVLRSTDTRFWSIHDVQRFFLGELHCERVLFPCQYPQLRLPTRHGDHLWRANTSLKLPPSRYLKEFHMSFEQTLKKMEAKQAQMDRLIISDQIINIEKLDYFKRKTFFTILENILSFQDNLQLVSLENLRCRRLEGVRLLQQLACFNAPTLKYLFLWRFVLPNENPILINYSYITAVAHIAMDIVVSVAIATDLHMSTDEEKCKLAKLLQGLEVPEVKITERSLGLVKEFQAKFGADIETKPMETEEVYANPYVPDKQLLEENERKLRELLAQSKKPKISTTESCLSGADPKRPWRTHSNKEKLLRIDGELRQHTERGSQAISPMNEGEMKELVEECRLETCASPPVGADRLRETVNEARRHLPNFQYRTIENSTATAIFTDAHLQEPEPQQNVAVNEE